MAISQKSWIKYTYFNSGRNQLTEEGKKRIRERFYQKNVAITLWFCFVPP